MNLFYTPRQQVTESEILILIGYTFERKKFILFVPTNLDLN